MRTPKLQLAAEQLLTGECWIPPKRCSTSKGKGKAPKVSRRGKIVFRIKPHTCQRRSEGSYETLCTPGPRDLTKTESELCLSISCGSTGQQWTAAGAGALGAADLGWVQLTWVWHKTSWRRSPLTPPQSCQNLHRTGETNSWRAQTEPCAHQDPGERSSDPRRD